MVYIISYNLFPVFEGLKPPMIGASAGAMSVFIFLSVYMPNYTFRIFDNIASRISSELLMIIKVVISLALLIYSIKYYNLNLSTLFCILIIFETKIIYMAAILVFTDFILIPFGNSGGHLAHLGGAAWGYYYNYQLTKGKDYGNWIINFLNYIQGFFKKKTKVRKVYRKKTYSKNSKESVDQQKIDLILDKISKSGYDSLTKSEKDTLFKAGQN